MIYIFIILSYIFLAYLFKAELVLFLTTCLYNLQNMLNFIKLCISLSNYIIHFCLDICIIQGSLLSAKYVYSSHHFIQYKQALIIILAASSFSMKLHDSFWSFFGALSGFTLSTPFCIDF